MRQTTELKIVINPEHLEESVEEGEIKEKVAEKMSRQTSELLKVVTDPEPRQSTVPAEQTQPPEAAESEKAEAEVQEQNERERKAGESQALEAVGFARLQPLMNPLREAELSLARLDPHLVALHHIDPEAAAQFNRVAIALIAGAIKHPPLKRVLLASAHHCEGRTCVTLNLAAALARAKQRVLVVDTDLLRPSVSRLLGVEAEVGLAEALADHLPPEAAVTRVLPIGFDVLPTRGQVENSAELLASPDFEVMLNALDTNYDFILFDSSPLLASADASLIMLHIHKILVVMRPGTTTASQMAKAVSTINEDSLFGIVMNRVGA